MKFASLLIGIPAALGLMVANVSAQTADREAGARTRAVLNYIAHLSGNTGKHVLSGQFLNFAPNATLALPEAIHQASGKWPAYIGIDYINFSTNSIDSNAADKIAIEYWRQGGLVELNVCLTDPTNPKGGGLFDKGVNLRQLLDPGAGPHAAWMHELDQIAEGLQRLQDAGVIVLWRPLMEMNGDWFWWGAQQPEDFIALWRHMFGYFTRVKRLHNLIWVYSPVMGAKVGDYYPGDRYVDLVGIDVYTDNIDADHVKGFASLLKTGKPAGFGEFGPHDSKNPPGDYDFTRFSRGLAADFPQAVFFMSWNEKWSPANNHRAKEFYNDPIIITRDDLPAGMFR
jgi:mannan endo-1,4-beta-mannosidase